MQRAHAAVVLAGTIASTAIIANAAAVITTDSVPQTSNGGWYSTQLTDYNRQARNISNNSFDTANSNNPDAGPGHTNLPGDSMWVTNVFTGDGNPFVIVDLGAEYTVESFNVWNYNELGTFTNRGTRTVDILSSTGERTMSGDGAPLSSTFALRQSFEFAQAPGTTNYLGQSFTFTSPFNARYIKLDINSNWGGDGYGLSEIQFTGSPVPEPAGLAMLGLAGLAVLRRRRAR